LAGVYVAQYEFAQAEYLLASLMTLDLKNSVPPPASVGYAIRRRLDDKSSRSKSSSIAISPVAMEATTPLTLAQWMAKLVRARLALQTNQPATALHIVETVIATAEPQATGQARLVPTLLLLHGETLAAFDRRDEAEAVLLRAQQTANDLGARPQLWRIHLALGALYKAQGRRDEAEAQITAAHTLIQILANTITDDPLRNLFLRQALTLTPSAPPLTPRRAAQQAFDGLTEREREVAALIVQGKSDREIAEQLVLSKRTVSTHVGNILNKLGFSSRSQIAAWVIAKKYNV
jgi:DNA-binding CsgD family transcriptional regulator